MQQGMGGKKDNSMRVGEKSIWWKKEKKETVLELRQWCGKNPDNSMSCQRRTSKAPKQISQKAESWKCLEMKL